MLLHRLFDNRLQIASGTIESLVAQHVAESFRLLDVPSAEQERKRREFTESWPYAPHRCACSKNRCSSPPTRRKRAT